MLHHHTYEPLLLNETRRQESIQAASEDHDARRPWCEIELSLFKATMLELTMRWWVYFCIYVCVYTHHDMMLIHGRDLRQSLSTERCDISTLTFILATHHKPPTTFTHDASQSLITLQLATASVRHVHIYIYISIYIYIYITISHTHTNTGSFCMFCAMTNFFSSHV